MKKKTVSVLSFVLAAFMVASLISCSQPQEEIFDLDISGEDVVGFGGLELTIASYFDSTNGALVDENVLGYGIGTGLADHATQRIADVEKALDCKINAIYMSNFNSAFTFGMSVGTAPCDIMFVPSMSYYSWMKAGYLSSISSLGDYIDYTDSEKWGTPMLLECLCYKDDLYGLLPAAWPDLVYSSFGYPLVASMNLISAVAGDDPRELYEQGLWTWETFSEQIQKCTVVEGTETKIWGLGGHTPYLSEMFFRSNGVSLTRIKDKLSFACGYYEPGSFNAIEYVRTLRSGDLSHTYDPTNDVLGVVNNFCDGLVCYSFNPAQYIYGTFGTISKEVENFAILRTPAGPDVDPGYTGGVYHAMNYTISFPSITDNIDAAAMAVDAIFEPFDEYPSFDAIKEYMTHNNFFDKRDAEAFFDICLNSSYNYFYTAGGGARSIPENAPSSEKSAAELIDGYRNIMDEMFATSIGDTLNGYVAMFGEE